MLIFETEMAKKLITLQFEEDYDFLLLGIFCTYRDYKLCYEINRQLEVSMERQADLELKMEKKGSSSLFSIFSCNNADDENYFIINNKGSNGHFLSEMKQVDYFLMIRNYSRYTNITDITKRISELKNVSVVTEMDVTQLKSAENFLMVETI